MKAVLVRAFGPVGQARVEDVDAPVPGPHEVKLDVVLAPANYVDTIAIQGNYQFVPELPFIPGKGPVGFVSAVGEAVSRFRVGDRVLAMTELGGYAQAVCVDEEQCYGLPETLSFEAASTISLAYDTAWFALTDRARLEPGETVLVLGSTGAVGLAAIQLAKAKGARVIAAVSSRAKAHLAIEAGADATIDLSRPDLRESLRSQVRALTKGQGADIVIDPLGDEYFDAAIRALAWRGRLVVIGFAAGRIPTLKVNYLLVKNIEVTGLQISDYRKRTPHLMRRCFEDVFDLYRQGKITPGPVVEYPLADYGRALSDILERRIVGRAVLRP